jgi:hypothetical protein
MFHSPAPSACMGALWFFIYGGGMAGITSGKRPVAG